MGTPSPHLLKEKLERLEEAISRHLQVGAKSNAETEAPGYGKDKLADR